jgi:hypothetical protein
MTRETRSEVVENEWYHVRYSGETPEIALHSSFYFIMEDPSGPGLILTDEEKAYLLEAARDRYCEIVVRDILPGNRDSSIYRGVLRSICNWRRFKRFCGRHDLEWGLYVDDIADKLRSFLRTEVADVRAGTRQSCINCTYEELQSFALEMGVALDDVRLSIKDCCRKVI